jgi:hypothetical protein
MGQAYQLGSTLPSAACQHGAFGALSARSSLRLSLVSQSSTKGEMLTSEGANPMRADKWSP